MLVCARQQLTSVRPSYLESDHYASLLASTSTLLLAHASEPTSQEVGSPLVMDA